MRSACGLAIAASVLVAGSSGAAIVHLTNDEDGSALMQLAPFGIGTVNILITTSAADTIPIAFLNAFLDTSAGVVDITDVEGGPTDSWHADRSSFNLPAELSQDQGNEYALITGTHNDSDLLYPASGAYLMDQLTVQNDETESGSVLVTFEMGARQPAAFGPAPTFTPYITVSTPGVPADVPNWLYVGDANSNNPAFVITLVPEPASLVSVGLSVLIVLKKRLKK